MLRKIYFLTKLLSLTLIFTGNLFATEISIIPLKKPILDKEAKIAKISQGILKPKSKPLKKEKKKRDGSS